MSKARNIPLHIDPFFVLMVALLSFYNAQFILFNAFLWSVVIVISVLLHEYGHALTALYFGQPASIHLVGFGGLTKRQGAELLPWQEFVLVLNGPLVSLLLAAFAKLLLNAFSMIEWPALQYGLQVAFYANLFWTFLNLLPIQPLDGGQLVRIALQRFFGVRGLKIALFASFAFALCMAVLFFIFGQLLLGSFFLLFTFESFRSWQQSRPLTDQDKDIDLLRLMERGEKELCKGDLQLAYQHFQAVQQKAKGGVLFLAATGRMAEILKAEGKYQAAYAALAPHLAHLAVPQQILLQALCVHLQRWQEAICLGNSIYKHQPESDVAANNALAHAACFEVVPAIGWLQCYSGPLSQLLKRAEFDSIRNDPRFKQFEKQHA